LDEGRDSLSQWHTMAQFIRPMSEKTLTDQAHALSAVPNCANGLALAWLSSSCPDDDFILSAVAKLPVEIWQQRYRKVLEPFFDVRLRVFLFLCRPRGYRWGVL
jgi:hypothetical protein